MASVLVAAEVRSDQADAATYALSLWRPLFKSFGKRAASDGLGSRLFRQHHRLLTWRLRSKYRKKIDRIGIGYVFKPEVGERRLSFDRAVAEILARRELRVAVAHQQNRFAIGLPRGIGRTAVGPRRTGKQKACEDKVWDCGIPMVKLLHGRKSPDRASGLASRRAPGTTELNPLGGPSAKKTGRPAPNESVDKLCPTGGLPVEVSCTSSG